MAEQNWDEYIDHIIEVLESIELHKITVLTGRNGGGKSMIRKLLPQFLQMNEELKDRSRNHMVASTSMELRACSNPDRMRMFDADIEWIPTSENTFESIRKVLDSSKDRYIVLDEIELGMGEETQVGLGEYLNKRLEESKDNYLGVLIITHSRCMLKYLNHDAFINLEGMTEDEWINREIVPESPEDLSKRSLELYRAFEKRLKRS